MPLEDKDIFNAVFERYHDQPIEFVMSQYEKAKLLNREIELRLNTLPPQAATAQNSAETQAAAEDKPSPKPVRKRLTKEDIVADPEKAITDENITCCLCGQQFNRLTARHLKIHGISVKEYKSLCGYTSDQELMSYNLTMAHNVQKAQAARKARLLAKEEA